MDKELFLEENKERRTKVQTYTRVMGYHRPVSSFNTGKVGEHNERTYFKSK